MVLHVRLDLLAQFRHRPQQVGLLGEQLGFLFPQPVEFFLEFVVAEAGLLQLPASCRRGQPDGKRPRFELVQVGLERFLTPRAAGMLDLVDLRLRVGAGVGIHQGDSREALLHLRHSLLDFAHLGRYGLIHVLQLLLQRLVLGGSQDFLFCRALFGDLLLEERCVAALELPLVALPGPQAEELIVERPGQRDQQEERADEDVKG